ncbi:conserved hypothetical protein [Nitrospina gracilis 3/211]|uniref:Peptidase M14 domain-containing protein n=1 Tax=Nitrospina gracilis (strain 3/211) TaxID=1266370 RepID=M1Z1H2_NITG3|nr:MULTISPECIES: M14 family metallocarboxypeptidase [Nitrospina]CCQ91577.1 conserved hypothetical protein [Nitrospina gracilis 3/211]
MNFNTSNSYQQVVDRVRAAAPAHSIIDTLGNLEVGNASYPLLKITFGTRGGKTVLISAGIHGDEPAGVEAVCTFLESRLYEPYLGEWEFHVIPCINPTGFEAGTRENHAGEDLNRAFQWEHPPLEVACVKSVFANGPFDLDLELHEDVDSVGYYLYQKDQDNFVSDLGRKILDAVELVMPLDENEEIEESPADRGLLARLKGPEEMDFWPMAIYAYVQGCRHMFTMETSGRFPLKQRIEAHLTGIEVALREFSRVSR